MNWTILALFLCLLHPTVKAEEVVDGPTPEEYLATHPMEPFDKHRLKDLRKSYGEQFANDVYSAWIKTKNFGDSCSELVGNCEYYLCREKQNPCGVGGYYLSFGYQYCEKSFTDLTGHVSPRGQAWVVDVASCLQKSLDENIAMDEVCGEVKDLSILSHTQCYKETNFCGQKISDVLLILKVLAPELTKAQMLAEGMRILANCL